MATNGTLANGPSEWPSISPDGNIVAFNSSATNLGAPPTHGVSNVYVRDISGATTLTWFTEWISRRVRRQGTHRQLREAVGF